MTSYTMQARVELRRAGGAGTCRWSWDDGSCSDVCSNSSDSESDEEEEAETVGMETGRLSALDSRTSAESHSECEGGANGENFLQRQSGSRPIEHAAPKW